MLSILVSTVFVLVDFHLNLTLLNIYQMVNIRVVRNKDRKTHIIGEMNIEILGKITEMFPDAIIDVQVKEDEENI